MTPDDELIDLIYAALLGEAPWQRFLDRLADSAPSGKTLLVLHDNSRNDGFIPLASGIPADVLGQYNGHFAQVNPFMRPASVRPLGVGLVDEELLPNSELVRSEFFNDLLKPHEMPARVALTINRDAGYQFILASLGSAYDSECKQNIADQLTRLSPHLRRASDYYRKGPVTRAATELGCSLFDAVGIGVVVIGDGSRVKAVSETGQIMLQKDGAVAVSPLGTVSLRDQKAQRVLATMMGYTYSGPKVVSLATPGADLTLIRVQRDNLSLFFEGITIIVLMNPPARGSAFDAKSLAKVFGISNAEMRVLRGILEGKSVNKIAEDSNLSRETIRGQLKSLFSKTGTHGQAELMRLVWFGKRSSENH